MLTRCQQKKLKTCFGGIEKSLPFCTGVFDGVWAYASLLHMPKHALPGVLAHIHHTLADRGIFYVGDRRKPRPLGRRSLPEHPKHERLLPNHGFQAVVAHRAFDIGMKERIGERWVTSKEYSGCKRFFSFYKDSELRRALLSWFTIEYASRIEVGNAIYLNYLCQRA